MDSAQHFPSGTVTFLFTDIEGSTQLAQEYPHAWQELSRQHDAALQAAVATHHGYVFKTIGDAFCVAFSSASEALNAAVEAQCKLQAENWVGPPVKVRMGIHTGEAEFLANGDYLGYVTLSLVQRVVSAGHGGQVLVTQATASLVPGGLPADTSLRDIGEYKFKDVLLPTRVYQVVAPDLASEFPPLRALDVFPNNLPAELTSFVGREKELSDIRRLLDNARLLTLIGPGGTGKTRLSIQAASEALTSFPHGVWLVELASILDPALVPRTAARAMGLRDEPQRPAVEVLRDHLRDTKTLMILDNCEHLVDACAAMAEALLHAAPGLQILASSREALGIGGEVTYRVPSLGLPDMQHLPPVESLGQFEAVKLFIERAASALPAFTVTNTNAPALAQICYRLDGIPLAIELAAAKVRVLNVEQIAQRLDDRFRLLTGGSRTAVERHQTLRAAIDWSYNLLPPAEQTLFRNLSVFIGGWSLEAAESVCRGSLIRAGDVLELMEQLINKSLVIAEEMPHETRYRFLETMRQYANEKLVETGDGDRLRMQHLAYFVGLAEQAEPGTRGPDQVLWLDRLELELANLRAAWEWSYEQDAESCLRLTHALWRLWDIRGYEQEGVDRGIKVLASTGSSRTIYRARTLASTSHVMLNSNLPGAEPFAKEAYQLGLELDDKPSMARALINLGRVALSEGRDQAGLQLVEQSMSLAREIGDHLFLAAGLGILAWLARTHDLKLSTSLVQQALEESRRSGDRRGVSWGLSNMARNLMAEGNADEAEALIREALSVAEELGDRGWTLDYYRLLSEASFFLEHYAEAEEHAMEALHFAQGQNNKAYVRDALQDLAFASWGLGDLTRFKELAEEGVALGRELGATVYLAESLGQLARAQLLSGELSLARRNLEEALAIHREYHLVAGYLDSIELFAALAIAERQYARGARLLGAREKLRESVFMLDFPLMVRQRADDTAAAREDLGQEAFHKAWEEGRSMSTEESVQYALGDSHE